MEDGQVVVVTPFDGSPAAEAGIRPAMSLRPSTALPSIPPRSTDTIERMRGKEGTSVKIGILREGSTEPLQFTLKRSRVQLHSVKSELPEAGYGYVRISQFSETTGEELMRRPARLAQEQRRGRSRAWCSICATIRAACSRRRSPWPTHFLDSGVIVSAKGRTPESNFEMSATPGDDLNGAPIVVLVNGGSASAAEIVAGALKDHHRATLMGRTTFGKGSVQTVMPLSGDRAIKLTTSLYYTPSGVSINHRGIAPDIELERDPKPAPPPPADAPLLERDSEVKRAIQELKVPTVSGRGAVSAAVR